MKMKSVFAAIIAAAAISCTSVCAFAENADPDETSTVSNVTEAADPMDGNPVSGVDGAAALAGVVVVAGAALVISHKRG